MSKERLEFIETQMHLLRVDQRYFIEQRDKIAAKLIELDAERVEIINKLERGEA